MPRRGARRAGRRTARRTTRRTVHRTSRRRRRRRRRRIMVGGMVVLAVGGAAYGAVKLSQQDSERIEEYTGDSVEELTEEELVAAMKDLGIESIDLSDEDKAALAAEGGQADVDGATVSYEGQPQAAPAPQQHRHRHRRRPHPISTNWKSWPRCATRGSSAKKTLRPRRTSCWACRDNWAWRPWFHCI